MANSYLHTMEMLSVVQDKLRQIKPELVAKYPISSIGLFGSVVRDDFTDDSDIDIVVEFSAPMGIEFVTLADELEALLKRRVDLVSRRGIKPKYFEVIEKQIVYV